MNQPNMKDARVARPVPLLREGAWGAPTMVHRGAAAEKMEVPLPAPPVHCYAVDTGSHDLIDASSARRFRQCLRGWLVNADGRLSSALISTICHLLLLIALGLLYPMATAGEGGIQLTSLAPMGEELENLEELEEIECELDLGFETDSVAERVDAGLTSVETPELSMEDASPHRPGGSPAQPGFGPGELCGGSPWTTAGTSDPEGESSISEGRPPLRSSLSAADAVSGLGGDIARRLKEGDTLVVWLFDASTSMRADRLAAGQQMVHVFRELDGRLADRPYLHEQSIMFFGQGSRQLVPPTRKWKRVTEAVPLIPNDPSGVENVFAALEYAIPEYRKNWSKQLLFVVWTDESGNDVQKLEGTIALCREHDVSVSVVGPTAVLGRRRGLQFFRLNRQWSWWLPVDKGPDAAELQLAQLPHWFGGPQPNAMPSGFGPYSLVRLSRETGGSFTVYDRRMERSPFRIENLSAYLPDYRDRETIRRDLEKSRLRRAVVEAAEITARAGAAEQRAINAKPETYTLADVIPKIRVRMVPRFDYRTEYWYDPARFRTWLADEIRIDLTYVRATIPLIDEALRKLSDPYLETELKRETSARWRADYLLLKGRLLAMSVRSREYERLASEILAERVIQAGSNEGEFAPSSSLATGDANKRQEQQARELLQRCIDEHPGTPWATLAKWEMKYSLGLRFQQRHTPASGVASGIPTSPSPPRL